jgi:hypothetical protein
MVITTLPQHSPLFSEIRAIALEAYAQNVCEAAGVPFRGIQPGYNGIDSLVLFDEPGGSTLGVSIVVFSAQTIRERIKAHARQSELGVRG